MGVVSLAARPVIRATALTDMPSISFLFFMARRFDDVTQGNRTFLAMLMLLRFLMRLMVL
jgi:hypothetical protein